MDKLSPRLLKEAGLKGMIGKGQRGPSKREACKEFGAVYFAAVGGAGALIGKTIMESEIIAYEDLGPEAIRRMVVKDFPAIVVNDIYGEDVFEIGRKEFQKAG